MAPVAAKRAGAAGHFLVPFVGRDELRRGLVDRAWLLYDDGLVEQIPKAGVGFPITNKVR